MPETSIDPYYAAFLEGKLYRKACYSCPFACRERVGDFTIGDYWGIERIHPTFDCKMGASLLLINTEKGLTYFAEQCEPYCVHVESNIELACRENHNLTAPTRRTDEDAEFAARVSRALEDDNADLLFSSLLKRPFSIKRTLSKYLPESVVVTLKRFLHR